MTASPQAPAPPTVWGEGRGRAASPACADLPGPPRARACSVFWDDSGTTAHTPTRRRITCKCSCAHVMRQCAPQRAHSPLHRLCNSTLPADCCWHPPAARQLPHLKRKRPPGPCPALQQGCKQRQRAAVGPAGGVRGLSDAELSHAPAPALAPSSGRKPQACPGVRCLLCRACRRIATCTQLGCVAVGMPAAHRHAWAELVHNAVLEVVVLRTLEAGPILSPRLPPSVPGQRCRPPLRAAKQARRRPRQPGATRSAPPPPPRPGPARRRRLPCARWRRSRPPAARARCTSAWRRRAPRGEKTAACQP